MMKCKFASLIVGAGLATFFFTLPVSAQRANDSGTATTANTQPSRQLLKAQKKAARKARRAKLNAELNQLQKNGYKPADDRINYPQNLQDAQQKANSSKGTAPSN
ncbi:DUF4148 domain-containing protein [Burkholderia multivorans]|uniref:DUF4148 domain-containing protein n=1 Tax=Burkholderia multivorans TaxID=87883 RepID=UPI000A70150E|nr:DUF4148 domain-containing protein [Burkholderia multivorans]